MILARLNTSIVLTFGPVLDAAGAVVTTEVVGNVKRKANGGAAASLDGSATLTHEANGYYTLALTAADIAAVGEVTVFLSSATNVAPPTVLVVLPQAVYDALIAGTGSLTVIAGTVSDKTGYSLTATTGLGNQTANITGNLSGSVGSVTGAVGSVTGNVGGNVTGSVGSVTGNVGGNVTGSVGSVATGGITSGSFAAGAITAAAIAADAIGAAPSASAVASAVRTELATELGRIDATVSSRLATASYTAPPSAATVASQVRTELTTELGRLDAAVSTRAAASDLAAVAGYLDTEIAAILADTNELQTDWADGGRLDLILDAVRAGRSVPKNATLSGFTLVMTDSAGHEPIAGKTVTAARSIDGGPFLPGALGVVSEVGGGVYKLDISAADLNGAVVMLRFTADGCDDNYITFFPVP